MPRSFVGARLPARVVIFAKDLFFGCGMSRGSTITKKMVLKPLTAHNLLGGRMSYYWIENRSSILSKLLCGDEKAEGERLHYMSRVIRSLLKDFLLCGDFCRTQGALRSN